MLHLPPRLKFPPQVPPRLKWIFQFPKPFWGTQRHFQCYIRVLIFPAFFPQHFMFVGLLFCIPEVAQGKCRKSKILNPWRRWKSGYCYCCWWYCTPPQFPPRLNYFFQFPKPFWGTQGLFSNPEQTRTNILQWAMLCRNWNWRKELCTLAHHFPYLNFANYDDFLKIMGRGSRCEGYNNNNNNNNNFFTAARG